MSASQPTLGPDADDVDTSILSLSPLPPVLKHGLAAVCFFGFLSFVTSVGLLFYLVYKLARWQLRPGDSDRGSPRSKDTRGAHELVDDHLCPPMDRSRTTGHDDSGTFWQRLRRDPPNQFLVLILNLLFADIQQAMAFLLNVKWVVLDKIRVGTTTCWAQGWFVSTGDLASSIFISTIAAHTYLGVVRGYRMPSWAFYTMIAGGWTFNYLTAILGVIITNDGAADGGLYVRAGAWCWINSAYQDLRLFLHYLWIFISLGFTTFVYTLIFFHIRKIARDDPENLNRARHPHIKQSFSASSRAVGPASSQSSHEHVSTPTRALNYAKQHTFLLYPAIYVVCTTPLAAGRVATMAGSAPSLAYFCFAAAMIACNGWLDVLLYASTRRSIVFSDTPPDQDTGIDTFAFMRTPANRRYGNVVYVSGGAQANGTDGKGGASSGGGGNSSGGGGGGATLKGKNSRGKTLGGSLGKLTRLKGQGGQSEVSLREHYGGSAGSGGGNGGMAIQMETVTSVVVEVENNGSGGSGSRSGRKGSLASDAVSVASRV